MAETICTDCEHISELQSGHPRYWMCLKHPRKNDGFGNVTHTTWDKASPYMYCVDINGGECPLFEPKKEIE